MSNFRIAVIGADQLDPDHHSALIELSEHGLASAFALDAAASEQGFEALRHAMRVDALDAIIFAGPRTELRAWAVFALQNGWPLYSTHAVALTIEDMVEIRRAEQSSAGAMIQFGLTARHHESVQTAKTKAASGEYGRLMTVRGVCGCSGGDTTDSVVFDPGPQLVDLLHLFAGPFQDISGYSDLDRTIEPGTETNVLATLRTHSGTLANLHISGSQWRPTFRLELGFERGYLWLEGLNSQQYNFGQEVLVYARTDGHVVMHETVDRFEQSNGAKTAVEAFLNRLRDRTLPATGTSQDAFETLNTIQRVLAADPVFAPAEERHAS